MRDEHITGILEGAPLGALSEGELGRVRAHAARCEECARAFAAARVSAQMLAARAAETFEPSPFFQTRVLAALRERQAGQAWALPRLWKAAGALFASMLATVAALGALAFLAPGLPPPEPDESVAEVSVEESILAQGGATDEEMTYDQVLSVVYEPEDGGGAR